MSGNKVVPLSAKTEGASKHGKEKEGRVQTFAKTQNLRDKNVTSQNSDNLTMTPDPQAVQNPLEEMRKKAGVMVRSKAVQGVIYFGLFLALFGIDFYVVADVPDEYNMGLYVTLTAVFIIFILEIVLQTWCFTEEYLDNGFGFYFWTDFIGTASMIFDVPWLSPLSGGSNGDASILRASKAARVGARVARLLKLTRAIKMMRAMRVQSVLKAVADVVTEQMSRNVAMLVMAMAIIVPLFNVSAVDNFLVAHINDFEAMAQTDPSEIYGSTFETEYIDQVWNTPGDSDPFQIRYVAANGTLLKTWDNSGYDGSKNRELNLLTVKSEDETFECDFDITSDNVLLAWINIGMVIIVVVMLMLFSTILHRVVMKGVIEPMERIFNTINDAMKGAFDMDAGEEGADGEQLTTAKALEESVSRLARILKARECSGIEDALEEGNADQNQWILQTTNHNFQKGNLHRHSSVGEIDNKEEMSPAPSSSSNFSIYKEGSIKSEKEAMDMLNTWQYNCFAHDETVLVRHSAHMVCLMKFDKLFDVDEPTIFRFMGSIQKQYVAENPYHNFRHGVDVMQSLFFISGMIHFEDHLSQLEMFALLCAALCHDVGHLGVNNAFLVNTNAPLAMRYNDYSVLENLHASIMFNTMGPYVDPDSDDRATQPVAYRPGTAPGSGAKNMCNIFGGLKEEAWITARKMAVHAILMTDNSNHFKCINDMKVMLEVHSVSIKRGQSIFADTEKNRKFLCGLLLHMADISNPFRQWEASSKAANKIMNEFFLQGDKEKERGMKISMLCDRSKESIPKSQMGFIDFFITPFAEQFLRLFGELAPVLWQELESNREQWQEAYMEELPLQERKDKEPGMKARFISWKTKFSKFTKT